MRQLTTAYTWGESYSICCCSRTYYQLDRVSSVGVWPASSGRQGPQCAGFIVIPSTSGLLLRRDWLRCPPTASQSGRRANTWDCTSSSRLTTIHSDHFTPFTSVHQSTTIHCQLIDVSGSSSSSSSPHHSAVMRRRRHQLEHIRVVGYACRWQNNQNEPNKLK